MTGNFKLVIGLHIGSLLYLAEFTASSFTFYCGWNLEHVCCCTQCWLNAFIVFHKLQFCEGFRYVFDGVGVKVLKC